jgi:hypothetical protein
VTERPFGALADEELAPPFLAAGFRSLPADETSHLLVSPGGEIFRITLDPHEGVGVDFLLRGDDGGWRSYDLGLFLVRRADRAGIPRTRLPGGTLNEGRIRTELRFMRKLVDAVGQDLLSPDRLWLAGYPWPSTPVHTEVGAWLDTNV